MESSGGRGDAITIGIIHSVRKLAVEIDAYGVPKYSYTICGNDNEAINGMGRIR